VSTGNLTQYSIYVQSTRWLPSVEKDETGRTCRGPRTSPNPASRSRPRSLPRVTAGYMNPSSTATACRWSRTAAAGMDWTKRLARLAEALKAIPCRSAVIDGELVLPDKRGAPDFTGLAAGTEEAPARARGVCLRSPAPRRQRSSPSAIARLSQGALDWRRQKAVGLLIHP
jgi:hypothetical protein